MLWGCAASFLGTAAAVLALAALGTNSVASVDITDYEGCGVPRFQRAVFPAPQAVPAVSSFCAAWLPSDSLTTPYRLGLLQHCHKSSAMNGLTVCAPCEPTSLSLFGCPMPLVCGILSLTECGSVIMLSSLARPRTDGVRRQVRSVVLVDAKRWPRCAADPHGVYILCPGPVLRDIHALHHGCGCVVRAQSVLCNDMCDMLSLSELACLGVSGVVISLKR